MISTVTDNKIETKRVTGKNFRLVHDTKNVITVIEGTEKSTTHTIHEVEEFETEQEVQDFIEKGEMGEVIHD